MGKQICISADSHVVEPPEVFQSLVERFGEEAPRVQHSPERGQELVSADGRRTPVAILGRAGIDPLSPEWKEAESRGYDVLPGILDVHSRVKDQEKDGVDGEVLYPSLLLSMFGKQETNLELVKATFRSYNEDF